MHRILVSGLINIETTARVDGFPVHYTPVRYPFFGVRSTVSGVGYNAAKALVTLGQPVHFLSIVGHDLHAGAVYAQLKVDDIPSRYVIQTIDETAQSVILYTPDGTRMINVDLKDLQEQAYPDALFRSALADAGLVVLCNINFSRPMLRAARERGIPIATDVHAIGDLEADYDRDFMQAADILFMSDEHLPCSPDDWVRRVWDRYETPLVVVGLGAQGALLGVRDSGTVERVPAVYTRPVVNTIGAGDALFSAFVHVYHTTGDPRLAIRKAVVFASYKIGATGAADGFLTAGELDAWCARI